MSAVVTARAFKRAEEVGVFYEDPGDFYDGIFVAFGDGSVKFLEGNFMDHAEALEAIANTFGFSEKAASDLVKKGKAIDALLGVPAPGFSGERGVRVITGVVSLPSVRT